MRRAIVRITGMTCGHCLRAVNDALVSQPGVQLESLRMGRASVRYDDRVASPATIESAIREAGYSASVEPSDHDEVEERA